MAIYPIVDCQELDKSNAIPPHKGAKPTANDVQPNANPEESLIDFGDQAPAPQEPPTKNNEITDLLTSTGKPSEGPLLDFTDDLKKDLPAR